MYKYSPNSVVWWVQREYCKANTEISVALVPSLQKLVGFFHKLITKISSEEKRCYDTYFVQQDNLIISWFFDTQMQWQEEKWGLEINYTMIADFKVTISMAWWRRMSLKTFVVSLSGYETPSLAQLRNSFTIHRWSIYFHTSCCRTKYEHFLCYRPYSKQSKQKKTKNNS